jgi:hypothetical protein
MKYLLPASIYFLFTGIAQLHAQMNVGSTSAPDASAILQVTSTAQGFRLPQVNLSATTGFGLTAPTVASQAYGMLVYNNNALITGSAAYPAFGAGVYTWDGTGWISPAYTDAIVLVANGNVSVAVAENTVSAILDLSSLYINTISAVTITGSNTVNVVTSGTYKIDLTIEAILQSSSATNAAFVIQVYKNGSLLESALSPQNYINGGSDNGVPYKLNHSTNLALSAGDLITFKAKSYGVTTGVNTTFQLKSLQVERLQ